ncbi:MAG: sigma 54-interacting transcriptional regulator [Desulfovibrio sp.]|uniref:sigma 54-interacting transcriptional regulator n=1 Tax=Desulfovibrio sp. 7SRBS1 TaxID=3378064 RepID=UPI003B404402
MERKTVADAARMGEQEHSFSSTEKENKARDEQAGLDLMQELSALPFHEVDSLDGDEFSLCDLRDFCFLLNDQGQILSANDSALRWVNKPAAEMKGLSLYQAVPGELGELLGSKVEQAWGGNTPLEFSVNMGQRYYRGSLCRLTQDGHIRLVLFLNDMTAARKLARNLSERESFYRELVQYQSELICTIDPDGNLRFVNAAFLRYYNLGLDSAPGLPFFSLIANEDLQSVQRHLKSLETQRPMATLEFRSHSGGGKVRWQQWNFRCLFDESGKPDQFLCVGRDISTRKIVEEALLQVTSEKEAIRLNLEAIFRSIQDGIVTVDTEMHVIEYNKAIARMCPLMDKLSPGRKMLGGSDFSMCGELCCEVVSKTLKTRKPVKEQRIECRAGKGSTVMVLNCSPLKDTMDKFSGAVLVMRDISRLAQLEQKLVERNRFQNIVGKSEKMQNVYDLLEQLAEVDTTVLVNGESGTGKELIVDALHYMGPRANGPLVKVNCSALSENLLESELFGHVRGSFTGAVQDKVGRFQAAEKGTIFLDEIGDISPRIQLKLLRGLERKEFERVGDNKTYYADVRVVAATNVDLMQKVREGVFREDLYYRLKVVTLPLPPLRERKEDIPLLVEHFLGMYRKEFKKHIIGVSDDVLSLFLRYGWPGNVRELKHAMEHACILCHGEQIEFGDLPSELGQGGQQAVPLEKSASNTHAASRQDILDALTKAGGNKAKAARILGISRRTLYRKINQLEIVAL